MCVCVLSIDLFLFSLTCCGFVGYRPFHCLSPIPYDRQPGVSDEHPQFPIEFLSADVSWTDEYALIAQRFPDKTEHERYRNPLRWYAFDRQDGNGRRRLIGLLYAYGKGLPRGGRARYRQRSPLPEDSFIEPLPDEYHCRYRSRSSSLNSMQQSIRQRTTRTRTINPNLIHISFIVVDQAYRRMNIGSRLLDRVETYCQDFECHHIELVPTPDRETKEWYKKRAYREDIAGGRRGFLVKYLKKQTKLRADYYPYRP